MRYYEILEGIRMGSRDLSKPSNKEYTIGFEFEVAVDDGFPDTGSGSFSGYDADLDQAQDDFDEYWNNGGSTFDFEEWFNDYIRRGRRGMWNFIIYNDFEPKHGWVESADDYIEFLNQSIFSKFQRNKSMAEEKLKEYNPEYIEEFKKLFKNEYKDLYKDSTDFFNDQDKVDKHLFFNLMNYPKNTKRFPDYDEREKIVKERIKNASEEIKKTVLSDLITHVKNIVFREDMEPDYYTKEDDEYKDFDPTDNLYIYDENKDIIEIDDDINDLDDLLKHFNVDESDVRDALDNEAAEAEQELQRDSFNDWFSNNEHRYRGQEGKLGYVKSEVDNKLGNWSVVEDASSGVDAEIITPVIGNIDSGIKTLKNVFDFIKNDPYISTVSGTGLHINIGTWTNNQVNDVDWLKFLVVYKAERVLKEFGRTNNTYATERLGEIITSLNNSNYSALYDNISAVNSIVMGISRKYSSINLGKLRSNGIIEIRAPGGAGYEKKGDLIEKEIRRVVRCLEIASNPLLYKKEYIKKLYSMLETEKQKQDNKSDDPVDQFFRKLSNAGTPGYAFGRALGKILSVIRYPGDFDVDVANNEYTVNIHNQLISDLKEYQNIHNTDVYTEIENYLNVYDKSNTISSTRFMKMILRSLLPIKKQIKDKK